MVGKPLELIQFLYNQEHDKLFEIKECKAKRTLNQNAYAWKLINELANVLRLSKEELYLRLLNDYGQSEEVCMLSQINPQGYFKYYQEVRKVNINTKELTIYKVFKGTSEYNTKEMAIFLDGLIQECETQHIPTLKVDEILKMNRM